MSEQLEADASYGGQAATTVKQLTGLFDSLSEQLGTRPRHQDCPTPEHVAGYYIAAYGDLDSAIAGVERAMSGEFTDQVPNPGDYKVLDILLQTKMAKGLE